MAPREHARSRRFVRDAGPRTAVVLRAMNRRVSTVLVAATLLGGVAPAQVRKGGAPPEFEIEKTWNGAPKSFAEFAGKVVLLDFAQTW
jgi:hypothetical protein